MKGPEKETIEKLMREAAEALPVSGETELQVMILCFFFLLFCVCFYLLVFFVCYLYVFSRNQFSQCRQVSP